MRVKVLRSFCIAGERQEPDSQIEIADHIGRELVWLGKAEKVGAAAPAGSGVMTTESAQGLVEGKGESPADDQAQAEANAEDSADSTAGESVAAQDAGKARKGGKHAGE